MQLIAIKIINHSFTTDVQKLNPQRKQLYLHAWLLYHWSLTLDLLTKYRYFRKQASEPPALLGCRRSFDYQRQYTDNRYLDRSFSTTITENKLTFTVTTIRNKIRNKCDKLWVSVNTTSAPPATCLCRLPQPPARNWPSMYSFFAQKWYGLLSFWALSWLRARML